MYRYVAVACVVVALCAAAPQQAQQDVQILRNDNDVTATGYQFAYETSDGTSRQEKGELQNPGAENAALNVEGSYAYTAPNGKRYTVTFTAGENGFQPRTHLEK